MAAPNRSLVFAGLGSAGVALLHAVIILLGAPAYRYFGAADLAPAAERGSPTPALITGALVLLFAIWALYAFSGAGLVRRLPLLRTGLVTISAIYVLRGLVVFPEIVQVLPGKHPAPRMAAFSAVSLLLGLLYAAGTWRLLRGPAPEKENA